MTHEGRSTVQGVFASHCRYYAVLYCLVFLAHFTPDLAAAAPTRHWPMQARVETDLKLILENGHLDPALIAVERLPHTDATAQNTVTVVCSEGHFILNVTASDEEWSPTFYYGLQKLGFLFPHPRWQVTPTSEKMAAVCGQSFAWLPRFRFRGFHLHTMHPSEWLHGFLMGEKQIARDMINWSVRNGQNVLQIVLLKQDLAQLQSGFGDLSKEAQDAGLTVGIDVSFSLIQQKALRLVGWNRGLSTLVETASEQISDIQNAIKDLNRRVHFDLITLEVGSSEFSSTDYAKNIEWINAANSAAVALGKSAFVKVHTSINQFSPKYGNFNFLPQYTNPAVGILPHTVMFYGLDDVSTPVYGRSDFKDMKNFMLNENHKRETWYYPETSYFIALDIDIPVLLTDYLTSRSADMDIAEANGIPGHIDFTTGQELGYWLLDWTVALLANAENRANPYVGLSLLGEDLAVWKNIIQFQTVFFKQKGLIEEITSENFMDEIPVFANHVLDRHPLSELKRDSARLQSRLGVLAEALAKLPATDSIHNPELRRILEITSLRVQFAYRLRRALAEKVGSVARNSALDETKRIRLAAQKIVDQVIKSTNRYPEAMIFEQNENLSSYPFGYGWTVKTLHFWEREENMVRNDSYLPTYMNIYDPLRILF